jgi:mono/diheme cytochrome c family protein
VADRDRPAEDVLTEIPEHLLKRSRERRAALGLGGGGTDDAPAASGGEAPAAAVPATSSTPAPAPTTPAPEPKVEPPKPDPPYIQAAKRRKRIPYWAMPVLVALPRWGYVYVRTLEPPPAGEDDPLVIGADVFSGNCASCHGGTGAGIGNAPALADGHVIETFADWRDQAAWVRIGTEGWPADTYGDTQKPVGGSGGVMPAWPTLTDAQLAAVVMHERELSGADMSEENPDNEDLYAVARGEMTLAEAGLGPDAERSGVTEEDLGG